MRNAYQKFQLSGIYNMNPYLKYKHRKRVKLIFNPASGVNKKAPVQLVDIIQELQKWKIEPEIFITEPDTDYSGLVKDAMDEGIRMFVVCGGDGTVSSVARALFNKKAILGIIPTGTQNNVALSLGIPASIQSAIAALRMGRKIKTDMGLITYGETSWPFLEVCSVGLFSALFQSGDKIQHGDITQIGDFITTLSVSTPSKIRLLLDNKTEVKDFGHVVLVSNMPFIGRNYQISSEESYCDGFLDVLFCADISKLNLMLGYMLKRPGMNTIDDPRLKRFRVKNILIEATPPMSVMADGTALKEGPVLIEICKNTLMVMAGPLAPRELQKSGD